jgi:galactokinase
LGERARLVTSVHARAPGRVNLIGEHTDYNGGFVLPCAIACRTDVRATRREDDRIIAVSSQCGRDETLTGALPTSAQGRWSDYVWGVLDQLRRAGVPLYGVDLEIATDMPMGAGLSSSASLEVATALATIALAGERMERRDVALLAQRAESDFVGARVGIMDQFAVLHGRAGHAVFLDTRSLEFELVPIPAQAAVVICNTMVRHSIASGEYNTRRAQCEEAVRILQARGLAIQSLRDLSMDDLQRYAGALSPEVFARARHVVTENGRVTQAVQALRSGNLATMGRLMRESHDSLRDDYEVSCVELDVMVAIARSFEGTHGARMTGGGFGGCTVNLVERAQSDEFAIYMKEAYRKETGIVPEIYDGTPSDGARLLDV